MVSIDRAFGPWRPDQPDLNNPGVITARNVIPAIGDGMLVYHPLKSAELYSAASMESAPRGGGVARNSDGEAIIYAGSTAKLYKIDPGTRQWIDTSRVGGYATSGNEHWAFTESGPYEFATNYSDYAQWIDKDVNLQFADITTLFRARHVAKVREFLVFGATYDPLDLACPWRVRWSAYDNPFDYNFSLSTMSDFQDIADGGAVMKIVGGETGYILLQDGITKMTFIGSPYVFQFDPLPSAKGKGCASSESVITIEGKTFYLANDGFYVLDIAQGGALSSIGAGKVDGHFLKDADRSQFRFMTAATDPTAKLIYWAYCSRYGTYGVPDKMIIFNYENGEWSEADCTVQGIMDSVSPPWTIEQLDVYGTIEDVPAAFDSAIWAGGTPMLWGYKANGSIYTFSGSNNQAVIETQEQLLIRALQQVDPRAQGDRTNISAVRPLFDGDGTCTVRGFYRNKSFDALTQTDAKSVNAETGFAYFRHQGRFHRFRFTLTGGWQEAIGFQIDANPAGFR